MRYNFDEKKEDIHEHYMKEALKEAEKALSKDEIPIGAVIVFKDKIIARSHNLTEQLTDFTAHAEMQAFTMASEALQNKYLDQCTLYVTIEPCVMCAGAAFWTRIGKIYYGAPDPKRGFSVVSENLLHPKSEIYGDVLADICGKILSDYFKEKR